MKKKPTASVIFEEGKHASFFSYCMGFLISLALTFSAYFFVKDNMMEPMTLTMAVVFFGLSQAIVQLVCFFNLGKDRKDEQNLFIFLFMVLVLLIIVIGSLWIMYHLNERVMPAMPKLEHQTM